MIHEPSRDVSDDEKELWEATKALLSEVEADQAVPITTDGGACKRVGIHPARARQIVRTWDNEGLVRQVGGGANYAHMTEYGRQVTAIESGLPSGESWR